MSGTKVKVAETMGEDSDFVESIGADGCPSQLTRKMRQTINANRICKFIFGFFSYTLKITIRLWIHIPKDEPILVV